MLKIMTGGKKYLQKYPKKRLLKTLLNFDVAVLLFLCVNLILGIHYSRFVILGSFIGLTDVGNSNWYFFTILLMYLVSYIAAVFLKECYKGVAAAVTICSVIYVIVAQISNLPSRFVSTAVTYALGMWIAIYKDELETAINKKAIISLIVILIPIAITYKWRENDFIMNLSSCFFIMLVVWFMAHFEIRSNILYFLGQHVFGIYILQRLPMLIISHFYNPRGIMNYVFVIICLALTVCMAVVYDKLLIRIDKRIIRT